MRTTLTLLALLGLALPAAAASPRLTDVLPTGGTRGTEVAVTFAGSRLADAQELLVYRPGITVKALTVVGPQAVKATLTIAPDCPLGEHAFRLRTAGGVSELRTFWVGALPVVAEVEPNSDFLTPQAIPLNSTVAGIITAEDVDYFVVDCKKGQRLAVEVEGMRLGTLFWDPYVAILDARRFELATSDDAPTLGQDAGCAVLIPADGKYVVQLRESAYGGGAKAHYRLHIGTFPRPTGLIPAGGRPGDEVELRFVGDPKGEVRQKVKLPAAADPDYRVFCQTADGVSPAGFRFRLADLPNTLDKPAAVGPAAATVGPVPGAFHGLVKPGESRFFKFAGKKGQAFDVQCYARRLGSPLDPVVYLHAANGPALGAQVAANDDTAGPDSAFRATLPADGDYYLRVHDHLNKGGPDYFFRIEVTPPAPATTANLPKVNGNDVSNQDRQSVVVPKGGRYATLVMTTRTNWSGPAAVAFPTLPAGVTAAGPTATADQATVPVVFEATAAAAVGATLTPVRVTPADGKTSAAAETRLDVNFNIGTNNTPFHRYFTDRVAVAVVEAAPYSIDVVEPKSAVPRNGATALRVVATRAAGFTGPITVTPLYAPPGFGIQGSATIPAGQTEIALSLNVTANAALKKWQTAVVAVADGGKGRVWISSKLFTLEAGPPVLALKQERAAVDQGQKTQVVCKVTLPEGFAGPATVKLLGLPAKVTAPDLTVTAATKELAFDVATDKTTPAGKHKLFCQVTVTRNGETLTQSAGGGELRVDVPLPPKVVAAAPAKPATPTAVPPVAAKPPEKKRLTRLEQLRSEQEEREKAGKPAADPKKPDEPKKL